MIALRTNLRQQLASVFGCPPAYLGLPSAIGGDLALIFKQFILNCVTPVARAIESGFNVALISKEDRPVGRGFRFDLDKAMLSDCREKVQCAKEIVKNSLGSINEARGIIGFDKIKDSAYDSLLYDQTNMAPVPESGVPNNNGQNDGI